MMMHGFNKLSCTYVTFMCVKCGQSTMVNEIWMMLLDVLDAVFDADADCDWLLLRHYSSYHVYLVVRRELTSIVAALRDRKYVVDDRTCAQLANTADGGAGTIYAWFNAMRDVCAMGDAFLRASTDDGRREASSRLLRRSVAASTTTTTLPRASHRFSSSPAPPDSTALPDFIHPPPTCEIAVDDAIFTYVIVMYVKHMFCYGDAL